MSEPVKGYTETDHAKRCVKCGDYTNGIRQGTVVSRVIIRLKQPGLWPDIAEMNRCCKCGFVDSIRILPGIHGGKSQAEKAGITMRHVAEVVRQCPMDAFTIEEFKAGKMTGFDYKAPQEDQPDRNHEPITEGIF